MTTSEPLLAVRDLTISFGRAGEPRTAATRGVSLTLHPDQTLAVVGESGSGKSVTALAVLRLLPSPPACVESGRVLFAPESTATATDLLSLSPDAIRRVRGSQIAMIFQEPMTALNPLLTVGEQVAEVLRAHSGLPAREAQGRSVEALASVGIRDPLKASRCYPHEFSGGMRQRVMIAGALACGPRVLIADEPTTALDVTTQAQILDLIDEQRRLRSMGVMLITHDLGVVAHRADAVCVMFAGRVVEYGPAPDVFASPLHPYTRGLLACRPTPSARRARLSTVREVIDEVHHAEGSRRGALKTWWPEHAPPPGATPGAADSILVEAAPRRWVRAWATPEARGLPQREPDVPASRSLIPGAAVAWRAPSPPRRSRA